MRVELPPTTIVCVVEAADEVVVPDEPLDPEDPEEPEEPVEPPYTEVEEATAVLAVPVAAALLEAASAWSCWPIAKAAFLKLVNELAVPSAPQFTANTIPWPQWLWGVFAACRPR